MDYCSDFKYDLEVGQVKEKELAEILQNKTIEVKTDLMAANTGNVFIEYECRGKPSGLSTTKSDFYCIAIEYLLIILPTAKLKEVVRPFLRTSRDVKGGDDNLSKGILLPIKTLIKLK
tara:strand:- start:263 stop:616 length:354 start_codon:yes stop_codon:yes gene_type:complete